MMDTICIIPVNTEIFCCRFQSCKTTYRFVGIGDTLRVGIFRHTPDTFDCRIVVDVFFYHIHIRTIFVHRNVDHLDAEVLCDLEVTVISRNRAQEFYFIQFAPWSAAHYTMSHGTCHRIVHNVQT